MHCHTMWSGDATTTPDELAEAVEEAGLDVICITDHSTIKGAQVLAERLACRVVVGEEVRTASGELIGLFLTERIPVGLPAPRAAARIREQGGLVYVPHPYDPMRHCLSEPALQELLADGMVDALEVFNAKTSLPHLNQRAADTALEAGVAAGAGSDAHVPSAFGAAFVEMDDFDGPASFLDALAHGEIVGHHYDAARPWTPRIVPSTSAFEG